MKKLIFSLMFMFGLTTQAAQIKIENADDWRVQFIPKNTQTSFLLGGADLSLTMAVHKAGVIPTVLVKKVASSGTPRGTLQWRELILRERPDAKPTRERTLVRGGQTRYIAEFESRDTDIPIKAMYMAMAIEGEIYIFSYQNPAPVFQVQAEDIFNLFKTVKLALD